MKYACPKCKESKWKTLSKNNNQYQCRACGFIGQGDIVVPKKIEKAPWKTQKELKVIKKANQRKRKITEKETVIQNNT